MLGLSAQITLPSSAAGAGGPAWAGAAASTAASIRKTRLSAAMRVARRGEVDSVNIEVSLLYRGSLLATGCERQDRDVVELHTALGVGCYPCPPARERGITRAQHLLPIHRRRQLLPADRQAQCGPLLQREAATLRARQQLVAAFGRVIAQQRHGW